VSIKVFSQEETVAEQEDTLTTKNLVFRVLLCPQAGVVAFSCPRWCTLKWLAKLDLLPRNVLQRSQISPW
jgi:hypothetical protein